MKIDVQALWFLAGIVVGVVSSLVYEYLFTSKSVEPGFTEKHETSRVPFIRKELKKRKPKVRSDIEAFRLENDLPLD